MRRILELFQKQHWGGETGWSAYGHLRAHRYHLQMNRTNGHGISLYAQLLIVLWRVIYQYFISIFPSDKLLAEILQVRSLGDTDVHTGQRHQTVGVVIRGGS